MKYVTIQLTRDQTTWIKWLCEDYLDADVSKKTSSYAFTKRLVKALNDQLNDATKGIVVVES